MDKDCQGQIARTAFNLKLFTLFTDPWPDGYSHAMYIKACADYWCEGELIVLLDSDTMLLEKADTKEFLEDGKLVIPYLFWTEHNEMFANSPWQKIRERVMGVSTDPMHYMARMPIAFWRSTFEGLRRHVIKLHGKEKFEDAVYSGVAFDHHKFNEHPISFCDYDCLGLYAAIFEPELYIFRHLSKMAQNPFRQLHSWSEWNPELKKKLDIHLHGHLCPPSLSNRR